MTFFVFPLVLETQVEVLEIDKLLLVHQVIWSGEWQWR